MSSKDRDNCPFCGHNAVAMRGGAAEQHFFECLDCGHCWHYRTTKTCDCPMPGFGQGSACRCARYPQLPFTADDWCGSESDIGKCSMPDCKQPIKALIVE